MMELFILRVISTFVLFAVILPLVGVALGLFCYYVLPYLFGTVVAVALAIAAGMQVLLGWWLCLIAMAWAGVVYVFRWKFRQMGEDVEHYRAAHAVLLFGLPYQRMKNQQRDLLASEG